MACDAFTPSVLSRLGGRRRRKSPRNKSTVRNPVRGAESCVYVTNILQVTVSLCLCSEMERDYLL